VRSAGIVKHLAIAFLMAVALYAASFAWIQHRRVFRGPWEITFISDAAGRPSLAIAQSNLKISETLTFPGQKIATNNLRDAERFPEAVTSLPFGEMVFQDPTFLPGNITMRQFGHEIQLLPRVVLIDRKEIPWRAGETIEVGPTNAPLRFSP
jgi:hypothetical protein